MQLLASGQTIVSVYGIQTHGSSQNSTYTLDEGQQARFTSSPTTKDWIPVQLFSSTLQAAGAHRLFIENFGDSLWLNYISVTVFDAEASSALSGYLTSSALGESVSTTARTYPPITTVIAV